jgi:quercetin dioxygenase-like cupin family protein
MPNSMTAPKLTPSNNTKTIALATGPKPRVVHRADMPAIHTVIENGKEQVLGILKEFRRDEAMSNFLPKDFRVAIAWVHLDPGQTLEPHVHPVDSMILICRGKALAFGDYVGDLNEGDGLLVPHGARHGFTGAGTDGFWGLSIQFNSRGLYEDLADPWAKFLDLEAMRKAALPAEPLDALFANNQRLLEHFSKHRLFSLVASGEFDDDKKRERFFDCFQVWSDHFQQMVLARAAMSTDRRFGAIARGHLTDELGHNDVLSSSRPGSRHLWDPVLESLCSWFPWKMMTSSDEERLVLVHLVVEASATVFYQQTARLFQTSKAQRHFDLHGHTVDNRHVELGADLLRSLPIADPARLIEIQQRGWDTLGAVFGRIADLMTT